MTNPLFRKRGRTMLPQAGHKHPHDEDSPHCAVKRLKSSHDQAGHKRAHDEDGPHHPEKRLKYSHEEDRKEEYDEDVFDGISNDVIESMFACAKRTISKFGNVVRAVGLVDMPAEIILLIADRTDMETLNSLSRACEKLSVLLRNHRETDNKLLRAIERSHVDGVKTVLQSPSATARGGLGLLAKVAEEHYKDVKQMCHNAYGSHRTVTCTETPRERLSRTLTLVRLLLEAGASINGLDQKRYTALHWAVTCICPTFETGIRLARVLLDYGADINSIGRNGSTPLHFAAAGNIRPAVSLLVEAGANVRRSDIYGLTPIHLASMNSLAGRCVRILEGAGGDIHPIDCEGAGAAIYPINIDTGSNGSRLSNKCSNDCYYHYHVESCSLSFYERSRQHPMPTRFLHNYTYRHRFLVERSIALIP